jgi:orotate phosphoribosyltransferase
MKEEIIPLFKKYGIIKRGEFVLSSLKKSNIYVDLRSAISIPDLYLKIIDESKNILEKLSFDAIAGIPTGGLVWASYFAFYFKKPLIYVRKEAKEYGLKKEIEGNVKENSKVLIIDDVCTTGSNILFASQKLRNNNYLIDEAFVIVDRNEGGREALSSNNIKLYCLFTLEEIIKILDKNNC